MSKGLEALEWLVENKYLKNKGKMEDELLWESVEIIEKELKALEILKRKLLDINHIDMIFRTWNIITKEEYDLIKEVLL